MEVYAVLSLVGSFGLSGFMMYLGYLFYEKNQTISVILLIIGVVLSIYAILSETEFKRKRHKAPWLFQ